MLVSGVYLPELVPTRHLHRLGTATGGTTVSELAALVKAPAVRNIARSHGTGVVLANADLPECEIAEHPDRAHPRRERAVAELSVGIAPPAVEPIVRIAHATGMVGAGVDLAEPVAARDCERRGALVDRRADAQLAEAIESPAIGVKIGGNGAGVTVTC